MLPHGFIKSNLAGILFLGPEIVLTLTVLVLIMLGLVIPYQRQRPLATLLGLGGLAVSVLCLAWLPNPAQSRAFLSHLFVWDRTTFFFKPFLALTAAVVVLVAWVSREIENADFNECLCLVLSTTAAMMMLAGAADLLMVFVAFETMSILCYLLVGLRGIDLRAGEAALKYVLYGAFTSGIMLFGFSLVYGLSGSTNLPEIGSRLAAAVANPQNRVVLVLAMLFFLAGLLFKTACFPFHFWCPDVYEGAPTPITAFLSVGPKAVGFVLFMRLFFPLFASKFPDGAYSGIPGLKWPAIVGVLSAATMTLGNLAAIRQDNLKRLLAYSSIAHAGYLLMGLAAMSDFGLRSLAFYLVVYLFMNLGAFAVVSMVASAGGGEEIGAYRGLAGKEPFVCVAMGIFLFSLIGLPPFAGFVGKVYLFAAVISREIYWLAVVAAINTVISLYYYLRIAKAMFLETASDTLRPVVPAFSRVVLVGLLVPTVGLGIFWQPLAKLVAGMF